MAVTYVTLYPPGGNSTQVQVVEGSQLHLIYAAMGFSATPSAPGPPTRPDPFPQYVHDDEIGDLLADAALPATDPVVADLVTNTGSATSAALRAAFGALDGDNVFTGDQRFNGGFGIGADPDPKQPVVTTVAMNGAAVRASGSALDKVINQINAVVTGDFTGDTGSNPGFLWGQNIFLVIGSTANDGKGLADITAGLVEANVGTPAGTTFPVVRGLNVQAAFYGASAGATVTQMESMRVSAPVRKDGATAGTATNVYGLLVEEVTAAAVGATGSAVSLFVAGGVSRFGGRVDVTNTIANAGGSSLGLYAGFPGDGNSSLAIGKASEGGYVVATMPAVNSEFLFHDGTTQTFSVTRTGMPRWWKAANAQTTVGPAGGAAALPATPSKYFKVQDSDGFTFVVPAYAVS